MKARHIIAAMILAVSSQAHAFDLKDLLGGSDSMVGNLVEGVFSKTNIEVPDMAGEWKSSGSAVSFKSDNFLKKAGGITAAAALEAKLNPYFKQYGLTGTVFKIESDGEFTMQVKSISLAGTITKVSDGVFNFSFKAFGKVPVGTFPAYVQMSPSAMDIMFDADKLRKLISVVASFSGNSLAKTASSLLDSYDGICVGFKLDRTGNAPAKPGSSLISGSSSTAKSTGKTTGTSKKSSSNDPVQVLEGLFKKKK